MSNVATPIVCGWRERVDLPEWGIARLRAKLDTGARTSAIHVSEIQELDDGRLRFEVVTRENPEHVGVWVEADPVREATVKPSSGKRQSRPVVRTRMVLGGVSRDIEVSLVCRKGMLCRMLIGRRALEGAFLVDPGARYLVTGAKAKRKKQKDTP